MVEDAVEGVMGGGERGMPGDRGHLSLGPLVSMRNEGVKTKLSGALLPADETEETEETLEPVFVRTSFLKEETGDFVEKLKREDDDETEEVLDAEPGTGDIVGEERTEEHAEEAAEEGRRVGSWYSRRATTRVT